MGIAVVPRPNGNAVSDLFRFSGCGLVLAVYWVRTLAWHRNSGLPGGSGGSRSLTLGLSHERPELEPQPGLIQSDAMRRSHYRLACITGCLLGMLFSVCGLQAADSTVAGSQVIEVAGVVEALIANATQWSPATNGQILLPHDRLRTGVRSRAALRFSDQSVMRLNERTTLEIQPPTGTERRRFRIPSGSLFFFNRERPADVQFETPIATGAIRGTEFVLDVDPATGAGQLALLDGKVDLTTDRQTLHLESGELGRIAADHQLTKSPLIETRAVIQWALHYPAIVPTEEMGLTQPDRDALKSSLAAYEQGDLLAAAASAPATAATPAQSRFLAALSLALGRVDQAEQQLGTLPSEDPVALALRELISVTRDKEPAGISKQAPKTAAGWMARSYYQQRQFDLNAARTAAATAHTLAPQFAFASVRLAEIEFGLGHRREALALLSPALKAAPRLAAGHSLEGFVRLEDGDLAKSLAAFNRAIDTDPALGAAWLGKGLVQMHLGQRRDALASLQNAAALEPQQATPRAYLGKAFSSDGQKGLAEKEFRLAKELDPQDPTAWLYSALHQWQQNHRNRAVRELETSVERNDNRSLFRSRNLLDRDQAVRAASLGAIYADAGLPEVGLRAASQAVADDYANPSAHLFLADAYAQRLDVNRFDLRYETVRQSELLTANLLAPPEAANLSQRVSQQEYLQFFQPRSFGVNTFSEYRSSGDRVLGATAFGSLPGMSYALDSRFQWHQGAVANDQLERKDITLSFKKAITLQDDLYLQIGTSQASMGDAARQYAPTDAKAGIRTEEEQLPNVYAGYHHAWSPNSHTLLLVSRLDDTLTLTDPAQRIHFLKSGVGGLIDIETRDFASSLKSDFSLYSTELQHLWETHRHTWIVGGRVQVGDVGSAQRLQDSLSPPLATPDLDESLHRETAYLYHQWRPFESLSLMGGISYDHLNFPKNTDFLPLSGGEGRRSDLSPHASLNWTPWKNGTFRGSYSRSLGGLFFDNNLRLEPTQLAGFNQAYRSLIPESVGGPLPGAHFETLGAAFDQRFDRGTYVGVSGEWLHSHGDRTLGAVRNASPFLPAPDTVTTLPDRLKFRERTLSLYASQLLGEEWSLGGRYQLSHAQLDETFPTLPAGLPGKSALEKQESALMHQAGLSLLYQHPCGVFGQWGTTFRHQDSDGYTPTRPTENFWQHDLWVGYRMAQRRAELRFGVLNLTDQDYRLSPINYYTAIPRTRTFVVSLRLNF